MRRLLFGLLVSATISLPLLAWPAKERIEISTTENIAAGAAPVVRVEGSLGQLNVVGWDEPRVQMVANLYTFAAAAQKSRAAEDLAQIQISKPTAAGNEIVVKVGQTHVHDTKLELQLMVPRGSKLILHHGNGDVVVLDVGGDIDATARRGNILIQLPQPGEYAVDALTKLGEVMSDLDGTSRRIHLTGEQFTAGKVAGHQIRLQTGVGGITIQKMEIRSTAPIRNAN